MLREALEASSVTAGDALRGPSAAPRIALEERPAGIWEEALAVPAVSVCDGFFELGGASCWRQTPC